MDFKSISNIGSILGYISTAIALFIIVRNWVQKRSTNYIRNATHANEHEEEDRRINGRLDDLNEKLTEFFETDTEFKSRMRDYMNAQNNTSKKLLANIIEMTYYNNRDRKQLDQNEVRRIIETYEIYHGDEIHGNSYITALYNEMMDWERV